MANPSNGGAFVPSADYTLTGLITFAQDPIFPGSGGGPVINNPTLTGTVSGSATYTTPTLTTPVISTGLTASGSAANDFSGSSGTFKTSTGAVTLGNGAISVTGLPTFTAGLLASGAVANDFSGSSGAFKTSTGAVTIGAGAVGITGVTTFNQATTPGFSLAAGATNTGTITINGKTSGSLILTTADATAQAVTVAPAAQTVGAATLTLPNFAGVSDTFAFLAKSGTFTNKTWAQGNINQEWAVSTTQTYAGTTTPALITNFSWAVVPGTYVFQLNLPTTMTTNGGLTISFVLTTAVLTSIQYQSYASTATDNATAVSTTGTTTTSATKVFDSKTAAYTYVKVFGTMVVGTGGTFQWDGTQNTSAGGADTTTILLGAYAQMTRVS